MNSKKTFNLLSYFRLPFYIWGLYFLFQFFTSINNGDNGWELLNNFLVLTGVGLAFASLKDTTRKANFISKRIWQNDLIGILAVAFISVSMIGLILFGLILLFFSKTYRSEAIAVGMIVLGIGMIGYLKYVVERRESLK